MNSSSPRFSSGSAAEDAPRRDGDARRPDGADRGEDALVPEANFSLDLPEKP
jgi:hypothetical protein